MVTADDELLGGPDADRGTDSKRARVAHERVAAVCGPSPPEVPAALCRTCVTLLSMATGLSVSVLGDGSELGVVLRAGDGVAARLAEVQYTPGEGPCVEAVRLRAPVFATDLTRVPDTRRWPLFSVQAARAGAEAVFSLPLTGAGSALGTLDLYRDAPGGPSRGEVRTAQERSRTGRKCIRPPG
ncbi:GAF domain-containing protein [Streptomyces scabiei]|uniref:GAF domain-containing protein n=1 Tax=Streptomyces scabiei TaxID=1930 RepID=UPI0033C7CE9F